MEPETSIHCNASVGGLSVFVPGSAKLIFPGTQIIEETTLVANSKKIELTSPLIELSDASLQVYSAMKRSFGSKAIHISNSSFNSSLKALTKTLPSLIASPAPSVPGAPIDLTGRRDFLELQDIT